MKSTNDVLREADELDSRRRHQIENQVATINRLLNGETYEGEIRSLHEELAASQAEADRLRDELAKLQGDDE